MNFIKECKEIITKMDINWQIEGLLDKNDTVFSIGDDSKLLGRIFEIIVAPVVEEVAENHNLKFTVPENQTVYPDFTLMRNKNDKNKIAIDVKTTYRSFYKTNYKNNKAGDPKPYVFTLGSFASFLRNNTKNIQFPYDTYDKHFIIGFVYTRNPKAMQGISKNINDDKEFLCPYMDVKYFIQEKWKIAGTRPGSGNTENIGSFPTNNIENLRKGKGPFSKYGEKVFEDYWKNYGRYREGTTYKNLEEYFEWKNKQ